MTRPMKDSGIAWVGQIPEHWVVTPVRSVLKEVTAKNILGKETTALRFRYGTIVGKDNFDAAEDEYVARTIRNYTLIYPGVLVLNGLNLNYDFVTKRVALSTLKGAITSAYMTIAPIDTHALMPEFVEYLFKSYDAKMAFHGMGEGVRKILNFNELKRQPIIYPTYTEQKRIVQVLDKKCAEIEELSQNIQKQIDTLEQYKRAVITETVAKGLNPSVPMKDSGIAWIGQVPAHWAFIRAKYVFAQKSEKGNPINLQLLSPTQKFGVIPQTMYEELTGMTPVKLKQDINLSSLKTIHKGAFCISLRSFQGGFEYSEYEGVVSPAYQVFYPTIEVVDRYYKYLFKDKSFIERMSSYTISLRDGKNISFEDFGNTLIPIPPLIEQRKIAGYLDDKCGKIDAIIQDKQQQLEKLEQYKKALIFEYVTGKKDVPEA